MTYSIPTEDQVADAIFAVMYRNAQVSSQSEMVRLVKQELDRKGEDYRISGERIRYVAIKRDMVRLNIEYNENDGPLPDRCPVCRSEMSSILNRTLDGKDIEVSRKCTMCSFSVGTKNHVPGRYTFSRKRR